MVLCIDGNNFLRLYQSIKKGITESQKKSFVRQLALYQEQRRSTIQEIILVFDAGVFGHATREVHSGIVVMHAGQRSSADEWICTFIRRNRDKDVLLVSNDRALVAAVYQMGAKSIDCQDFYVLLSQALNLSSRPMVTGVTGGLTKYDHGDDEDEKYGDSAVVDTLMEQASRRFTQKDETLDAKKGNRLSSAKKLSKVEKKTDKAIKKL